MLANPSLFTYVENELRKRGIVDAFEAECGQVRGRMMITKAEIPISHKDIVPENSQAFAFQATFDFYEAAIGIALDLNTLKPLCPIWISPQINDATEPSTTWIEFFAKTLIENISENGCFGLPMYTLISNHNNITIVPTDP